MENSILIYFLKASISIFFFYGLYMLFLRKDTFLKLRRFYFLFAIAFSLIFPFLNFEMFSQDTVYIPEYLLLDIVVTPTNTFTNINQTSADYPSLDSILVILLLSVSLLLFCKFIIQICSLIKLELNSKSKYIDGFKIIEVKDKANSSFSFFSWIFLNTENNKNANEIIIHEKAHVDQFHSFDVIISEIACIIFWWNPFIWLLKREMKTNLEYLADQSVLKKGINTRLYQYALLQESCSRGIPFINNFNVSQLKKRINMMNKKKTSMLVSIKYIFVIPLIAGLLMINCTPKSHRNEQLATIEDDSKEIVENDIKEEFESVEVKAESKPYTTVEVMPSFPGGEEELMKFITKNLKYPATAQEAGIQGRVTIRFTVRKDGEISDINILRGISPECDQEAKRVVASMPKWIPGKQDGEPVSVYFTLPIVFRLNN